MQFFPSAALAPYIKNYTVVTIEKQLDNEVFYPSGYIDLVINIFNGTAATIINGTKKETPAIELLGHLTLPTRLSVTKGTVVLIARIYPHAAALFFTDSLADFTNYATDLNDVFSGETMILHHKLMEVETIEAKINVLEKYFLGKLVKNENRTKKTGIAQQLCQHLTAGYHNFELSALAQYSGYSERYIQKLFLSNIGISPASFVAVVRFNKSLNQVLATADSFTAIAYEHGYYDQAHFIKEFRKFTGITPSQARRSLVNNGEEYQQAVNIGF